MGPLLLTLRKRPVMEDATSSNKKINSRILRLRIIDGSFVIGQVNINRSPGYERVSDVLTQNQERFLVLFQVTVKRSGQQHSERYETLFINRDHIIWAAPDEDQ